MAGTMSVCVMKELLLLLPVGAEKRKRKIDRTDSGKCYVVQTHSTSLPLNCVFCPYKWTVRNSLRILLVQIVQAVS